MYISLYSRISDSTVRPIPPAGTTENRHHANSRPMLGNDVASDIILYGRGAVLAFSAPQPPTYLCISILAEL